MDSRYLHQEVEDRVRTLWKAHEIAKPNSDPKALPYCILLPPPNANASLHAGHAMFVIEDILIRWRRMQGYATSWIPGTDHAGYETQYVYEKHLAKQGSSRFQFDRQTLYTQIESFVQQNSGLIEDQLDKLGFSLDWSRKTFTLDSHVIETVYKTFEKMVKEKLVYRDLYLVNYCPKCGTTFADLEIAYKEQQDPLYYIKYGPFTVATVRPETILRDKSLAVHPDDPRFSSFIGKTLEIQSVLGSLQMIVVADPEVDPEFGTGVMKITPAHDAHDFQLAKTHNLPVESSITTRGKLDLSWFLEDEKLHQHNPLWIERATKYHNASVLEARKAIVKDLEEDGLIDHVDYSYTHATAVCYKSNHPIEPLVLPNWFIKMKPLAEPAIKAAKDGRVTFVPERFEKQYYQWLENIRDWPISRQVVWGIRIPVWYDALEHPEISVVFLKQGERISGTVGELLSLGHSLHDIQAGLQELQAPITASFKVQDSSPGENWLPETDTFDTWFSSGQWPLVTLHYPSSDDFARFYPTAVLDTMWDILFFWVARMIMLGLYMTDEVPFKTVYLHSMVTDEKGQKMSKSKGNVINPLDIAEEFGADALRISLVAGSAPGNPIALSREKVKGYRNFANKLWNIARFYLSQPVEPLNPTPKLVPEDVVLLDELTALTGRCTANLEEFRFSDTATALYDFTWNTFANGYLEAVKPRLRAEDSNSEDISSALYTIGYTLITILILLHPFMPFVTEAIWQELRDRGILPTDKNAPTLAQTNWPSVSANES